MDELFLICRRVIDCVQPEMDGLDADKVAKAIHEQQEKSDATYEAETWFFNQIRDMSLVKYAEPLRERLAPFLSISSTS